MWLLDKLLGKKEKQRAEKKPAHISRHVIRLETFFLNTLSDLEMYGFESYLIQKFRKDKDEVITQCIKILPETWEGIFFLPCIPQNHLPSERLIARLFQNSRAHGTYSVEHERIQHCVDTPIDPYWIFGIEYQKVKSHQPKKILDQSGGLGLTDNELLLLALHNENWRTKNLIATETLLVKGNIRTPLVFKYNNVDGVPQLCLYDKKDTTRKYLIPIAKCRMQFN